MRILTLIFLSAAVAIGWDLRDTPLAVSALRKITPSAYDSSEHKAEGACEPNGIVAAVLRNEGSGWYALADTDHTPSNVASVTTSLSGIAVRFVKPVAKVRTFIVAPDEALAPAGVSAGASVSMQTATITLGRAGVFGVHQVSPLAITTGRYPGSNLWVYGLFDMDCR